MAYQAQDAKDDTPKAQLLDQALAANPYHLAAWVMRAQLAAKDAKAFNAVLVRMAHALMPEGAPRQARTSGAHIAKMVVARTLAPAYAKLLAQAKPDRARLAQTVAAMGELLEQLDDDGALGVGGGIWPLYLRHLAQLDAPQALEVANANLERALLGSADPVWMLDDAASPSLAAVRGLEEVAKVLPPLGRVGALAQACEKIESVYPHFSLVGRPELINGKTLYPKKVVANKTYEAAFAAWMAALRDAKQEARAKRLEGVRRLEREKME